MGNINTWTVWKSHSEWQTHTHNTQPFNSLWSGRTRVGRYQKKHSPTHTHPDHRTSFIIFLHLQRSMASSLFILRAWQSSCTTYLQVLFGLPLGLGHSTSYSIHFFTQSSSSFRSICPYQCSLSAAIPMLSSIPSLSLNSLLGSLCFSLSPKNNFSQKSGHVTITGYITRLHCSNRHQSNKLQHYNCHSMVRGI